MRNLKRALSLTLASVMLLGMMVVGSSAAAGYDDVSKTDNVEAIEVLQAIEVMVGDERGFGPERPVNRAEMAVVMGKLLNLDYNYYSATCPFDDVYDWARGWVGACAANGIVSGRGDGVYDPGATVTAVEAASMLMRALGYFKYQNDYANGFEVSTVLQGNNIGIFANVGSSATEPMTRNQVAQMVLNALQCAVVEPDGNTTTFLNPDGTVLATTGKVNYVSVTSARPYATAISSTRATSVGSQNDGYIVELGERLYDGKLKLNEYTTDAFQRPARHWEYDGKDVGTYMKKELLKQEYTQKVTGKMLYDLLTKATIEDYDFTIAVDGETTEAVLKNSVAPNSKSTGAWFTKGNLVRTNTEPVGATGDGVLTQVFVDPDEGSNGAVYIAIINTYLAKAVDDYNEKKDEATYKVWSLADGDTTSRVGLVKNTGEKIDLDVKGEDFDIEDVKKDDIVLVHVAEGEIKEIIDPEVIDETEVSAFKRTSWVNADGTQYDYSDTVQYDDDVLDDYDQTNMKDTSYRLFLDEYGYMIGIEILEDPNEYVFLTGIDLSTSNLSNKTADGFVIHTDGTEATVKINMDKSKNAMGNKFSDGNEQYGSDYVSGTSRGTGVGSLMNTWCRFTVDSNGTYTLFEVPNTTTAWDNGGDVKGNNSRGKAAQGRNHDETANTNSGAGVELLTLDKSHIYLNSEIDSFTRVYTNDDTVFITAETTQINATNAWKDDHDPTPDKTSAVIINGVDSVTTGADNVNLKAWDATRVKVQATPDYSADYRYISNGVYTLFDKDGYVIAAIVVGEDDGTTTSFAFVISGNMEQEGYSKADDIYTWTRKVIINGEETILTEKTDTDPYIANENVNNGAMKQGYWVEVKYDANGNVRNVENLSKHTVTNTTIKCPTKDFDTLYAGDNKYIYSIADVETATDDKNTVLLWDNLVDEGKYISVEGNTLQVRTNTGDKDGFRIASDCKTVLIQDGEPTINNSKYMDNIQYFTGGQDGAKRAVDRLEKNHVFVGFIGAVLENGRATSIIIYDKSAYSIDQGTNQPGNDNDGVLGISEDGSGNLTYRYYASTFAPADWETIRQNAANAAAAYLNASVLRNNLPTAKLAASGGSHTGTGGEIWLDDGSLRGESVQLSVQRVIKVTQDGANKGYIDAKNTAQTVDELTNGKYILGTAQKVTDSSETTVSGNQLSITPAGVTDTDADVALHTAYQVNIDALDSSATVRIKGVAGAAGAVTNDDWVKTGTVLVVTGKGDTGDDLVHQLVATDDSGDHNVGAAAKVDSTTPVAVTGEFTVSDGDVTFTEITGYTVKVPGKSVVLGVGDKVQFTGAHANAVYAAKKNVTDGHASTLTTGNLDNLGTLYEYTVNATDAASGEIELVQVAQVTLAGTGLTAASCTYKKVGETGASTGTIATTEYYEIGATLHIVGATAADATAGDVILVKQPSTGNAAVADASGTAESDAAGATSASADYEIQSADYDLNFSKGADPT